ncbi:MAG TPA: hypothetical protein VGB88_04230 [Alphaproteobacteria bacterium]
MPTSKRLLNFGHRESPYDRPNQSWVCGHLVDGRACAIGPDKRGRCRATAECLPIRKDDRWQCARPAQHGGRCTEGPHPDGGCGRPIATCQPVRSLAARRAVAVRWTLIASLGLVLLVGSGVSGREFVFSGELTFQHGEVGRCTGCHSVPDHGPISWLAAAFRDRASIDDSGLCLKCHRLGEDALAAHDLPRATVSAITERQSAKAAQAPLLLKLAKLTIGAPAGDQPVACGTCHREHNGRRFDLTAMSDLRCQTCHRGQFASLADGHPRFEGFPYRRRTRIAFDHASHIGKHFKADSAIDAPTSCTGCHVLEPAGRAMEVKPFEVSCAACHLGQIMGEGRAGTKGYPVLILPGFDIETLYARGHEVGDWPRDADGKLTSFMNLLLANDPAHAEDLFVLSGVDLMDLREATEEQLDAAARTIWSIKDLIYDLAVTGHEALRARVAGALSVEVPRYESGPLMGTMPVDAVASAQQAWFPRLAGDIERHRAGEPVPPPDWIASPAGEASTPVAPADAGAPAPADQDLGGDLLGGDEGGLLGGDEGGLLGGGEGGLLSEPAPEPGAGQEQVEAAEPAAVPESMMPEDIEGWMRAGGWYRQGYALLYRPIGHRDPFMRAWIDLTAGVGPSPGAPHALQIFAEITSRKAPGMCGKCHSVDATADGTTVVNWRPKQRPQDVNRFTEYAHAPHFSLLDEKGCLTCHVIDYEADFMAGFNDLDASTFASNFKPMNKELCASCHVDSLAGDACTDCHNYHIGRFPPALAAAPLAVDAGAGAPAPHD